MSRSAARVFAPRYPMPIRVLHWSTALLVIIQVWLALINALVYEARPITAETVVQAHISLGAVVLLLTLLRALLRLSTPRPAWPNEMPRAAQRAARALHYSLYLLLLALPVTGYLKLAALGFEIRLFGLITLPSLAINPGLALQARELHTWLAIILGTLLIIHVAAALVHKRLLGSAVLNRMSFG